MFWVISALIILAVVLLTLCNLYEREGSWRNPEWKKMTMPMWAWILIVLGCLIPLLNFCGFIVLIVFLISEIAGDDDYQLRGPIGKLIAWLTKEV